MDDVFTPEVFIPWDGLKTSYRLSQAYVEKFWRRFVAECVPTLSKREKWLTLQHNLKIGGLVLLHGEPGLCCQFAKPVVTDVHPNKFDHVRRVTVRSSDDSLLERGVANVCLLEANASLNFGDQSESSSKHDEFDHATSCAILKRGARNFRKFERNIDQNLKLSHSNFVPVFAQIQVKSKKKKRSSLKFRPIFLPKSGDFEPKA